MVITDAAGQYLVDLLDRVGADETQAVRVVREDDGWGMRLGRESPDDETFDHRGRTVVLLDPVVAMLLEDVTLELQQTERGPKLVLRNS